MLELALFLLGILVIAITMVLSKKKKHSNFYVHDISALSPKRKGPPVECRLVEKTTISHDTFIFKFQLPKPQQVLGINVGEHIIIHEQIPTKENPEGELVERKYTPTSLINQKGSFDLLVKVYRANENPRFPNGGKLTSWMDTIRLDQPIHISGPYGKLQYKGNGLFKIKEDGVTTSRTFNRIVMIAGGSGITPMYQIIQAIIHDGKDRTRLSLLFANKTEADILLYNELKTFASLKKLDLYFTLDSPPENWSGFSGFVTAEMVEKAFGTLDERTICLTCGPGPMNQLALNHYKSLGATEKNVFKF